MLRVIMRRAAFWFCMWKMLEIMSTWDHSASHNLLLLIMVNAVGLLDGGAVSFIAGDR